MKKKYSKRKQENHGKEVQTRGVECKGRLRLNSYVVFAKVSTHGGGADYGVERLLL